MRALATVAGRDLGRRVGPALVLVDDAHSSNGLLKGRPHIRVERLQSRLQDLCRHPQPAGSDPVEPLPQVAQRLGSTMAHVLADRSNRRQRRLDVELGSGQHLTKGVGIEHTTTEVDPGNHPLSLG